jgi:hypothetical protein
MSSQKMAVPQQVEKDTKQLLSDKYQLDKRQPWSSLAQMNRVVDVLKTSSGR